MTDERARDLEAGYRRAAWIVAARTGPLSAYLASPVLEAGLDRVTAPEASQATVCAVFRLQDAPDYRAALRAWFQPVRVGGHLVIAVPHAFLYERQLAMPSRWSRSQRRLYTPSSLLEEVEEALAPNSYRVRHLGDLDQGYDYGLDSEQLPVGRSDIVLVLEKIATPAWTLALAPREAPASALPDRPDYQFEPARTRVEVETHPALRRILLLKLDHLGDFIMGVEALERARRLFPEAEITLMVGSWNLELARSLGVADRVVSFDVFPRNSSEEEVNVPAKGALFQAAAPEEYDLAIDLRTDHDTRHLLRLVKAGLRAGVGGRAQFPFLDIFLPIDASRGEPESAREFLFDIHAFPSQGSTKRTPNRIISNAETVERNCAIVWGPYRRLRAGRYVFEPSVDIEPGSGGVVMLDVALDGQRVVQVLVDGPTTERMTFEVGPEGASFEARLWTVDDLASLDFSFFGGRLIRQGADSVLHQSEYLSLLVELVAMRTGKMGVLSGGDGA